MMTATLHIKWAVEDTEEWRQRKHVKNLFYCRRLPMMSSNSTSIMYEGPQIFAHLGTRSLGPAGMEEPGNRFPSPSFVTLQNLVALWHTMLAYIGGPTIWGHSSHAPWVRGMVDLLTVGGTPLPSMGYYGEFGFSRSNAGVPPNFGAQ